MESVMSGYYLHLRDFKGDVLEDEEGSELPSLAVAKKQAILALRELVGDAIKRGGELQIEAIVVADQQGTHVAAVPLVAALPPMCSRLIDRKERAMAAASNFANGNRLFWRSCQRATSSFLNPISCPFRCRFAGNWKSR